MSGDQLDLDAIEKKARRLCIGARNLSQRELYEDDVPALVAEVRRLRAQAAVWENVDRLATTTGYTHAQAAEQIRAVVALADDVE